MYVNQLNSTADCAFITWHYQLLTSQIHVTAMTDSRHPLQRKAAGTVAYMHVDGQWALPWSCKTQTADAELKVKFITYEILTQRRKFITSMSHGHQLSLFFMNIILSGIFCARWSLQHGADWPPINEQCNKSHEKEDHRKLSINSSRLLPHIIQVAAVFRHLNYNHSWIRDSWQAIYRQ